MQMESIESRMLSTVVNPTLRRIISRIDVECEKDGNLMVNSLRRYLGDDVGLCRRCSNLSKRMAGPFYEVGARVMRVDKRFMKSCFVDSKYGEAWLKGFALMMKGIGKYGARIPFTPGGPFEVVWNFTYKCNLKCKHCYENAGAYRPELSTEERSRVVDKLSKVAGVGFPALSFSGGEPLVRKDFFEVAAYTSGKIPHVSVATNGTLLTKDNVRQMKNVGIDFVEASLDGATRLCMRDSEGCAAVLRRP
jgi:sulfatase maturation enzyme AslB (radical SAM superfamily)